VLVNNAQCAHELHTPEVKYYTVKQSIKLQSTVRRINCTARRIHKKITARPARRHQAHQHTAIIIGSRLLDVLYRHLPARLILVGGAGHGGTRDTVELLGRKFNYSSFKSHFSFISCATSTILCLHICYCLPVYLF
jgi:hypothetical protein